MTTIRFITQQMKAIFRLELQIDRLEGKWKMSQIAPMLTSPV